MKEPDWGAVEKLREKILQDLKELEKGWQELYDKRVLELARAGLKGVYYASQERQEPENGIE